MLDSPGNPVPGIYSQHETEKAAPVALGSSFSGDLVPQLGRVFVVITQGNRGKISENFPTERRVPHTFL